MDQEADQKRNTERTPEGTSKGKPAGTQEAERILRPLRTFKDDVARALGTKGAGVVNIAASAEKRRVKRRTLSEREQALQEEIEREGAKIRRLTAELERTKEKEPVVAAAAAPVPEQTPSSTTTPGTPYSPPPGVPQSMTKPAAPEQPKAADDGAQASKEKETSAKLAELRASEKRLAEAQAKLAQTKQTQSSHAPKRVAPEPKSRQNLIRTLITIGLSVVFLAGAGGVGWYAYQNVGMFGSVAPEPMVPTLVPVNQQIEVLHTTKTTLPAALRTTLDTLNIPNGDLVQLYASRDTLTGRTLLTAEEFFALLAPRAPGRLARALADGYTFGAHRREQLDPFLVVRVTFFENAFAGMLEWEPVMRRELAPLLGETAFVPDLEDTVATTTSDAIREAVFVDQVIQNKDVRVLRDENDNISLLYAFIDRETLIITTNIETFVEVHGRMTSGRVVR